MLKKYKNHTKLTKSPINIQFGTILVNYQIENKGERLVFIV